MERIATTRHYKETSLEINISLLNSRGISAFRADLGYAIIQSEIVRSEGGWNPLFQLETRGFEWPRGVRIERAKRLGHTI